jgi:rod shape-determining protein MreC
MKRKSFSLMVLAAFMLVLGLFLDNYFNVGVISRAASLLKPVQIVAANVGNNITSGFSNFKNIGRLQNENKDLEEKLNNALQEIAKLSEAQKVNYSLKKELGFKATSNFSLIPAEVLSFDPNNVRDTIFLNVGAKDGIKTGQVVLAEGFLVGKITTVNTSTSKLMLISDPLSAIPAAISEGSSTGIVKGRIGSGLVMEQVPQSEKVDSGNTVVTSGLGGEFPKGLIIGKVDEVQKISGSIFQSITVRPEINLNGLERVAIIK